MSNAKVYVNGKYAGEWPHGYNSFYLDVTELIDLALKQQLVAIRLENPTESSRWYQATLTAMSMSHLRLRSPA